MRLSPHHSITIILLTALLFFTGCEKGTVIHRYQPTPIEGWEKDDTISFSTDTIKNDGTYNLSIGIRNTSEYRYVDLWLIVKSRFCNPIYERTDTIKCIINNYDADIGSTGIFVHNHIYPIPPLKLKKGQTGVISINHYMHNRSLKGISDLGIHMENKQ